MSKIIYVKPIYYYEGNWSMFEKKRAQKLFMSIRKEYVDVINPKIEMLNKEWNSLYPKANLEDEDTRFDYMLFMANHFNDMTKDIHREFRGYFDPKLDTDFVLINREEDGSMYAEYEMI